MPKNSFGAYIGIKREVVAFLSGRVSLAGFNDFACNGDVPFEPFRELESQPDRR